MRKLYSKIINTQPVFFLDLLKAIIVFLTATGILTLDSGRQDAIISASGIIITVLLSLLTHNNVTSNQTVDKILSNRSRLYSANLPNVWTNVVSQLPKDKDDPPK